MNDESYIEKLHNSSMRELQVQLTSDLACPIDWEKEAVGAAAQILFKKWFYSVADHMPNGEMDARLLSVGGWFLPAPNEESFEDILFDAEEALSLAFNCYRNRSAYRKCYDDACRKLAGLRAQTVTEREKHYAIGARSIKDMIAESKKKPDVGLLFPNFHPAAQRTFFWESVANAFEEFEVNFRDEFEAKNPDGELSEREMFDLAWAELFEPDHLRFCVDTMTTVGFSNQNEASFLMYDVSYHGKILHCFPVLAPDDARFVTALDNLQGIKNAFIEGRTDWP